MLAPLFKSMDGEHLKKVAVTNKDPPMTLSKKFAREKMEMEKKKLMHDNKMRGTPVLPVKKKKKKTKKPEERKIKKKAVSRISMIPWKLLDELDKEKEKLATDMAEARFFAEPE